MRHCGQRHVTELADSHETMQVKSHQGDKYESNAEESGSHQEVCKRTHLDAALSL